MGQKQFGLTPKQIECLRLVGTKQMTSKEIARELGISPPTVDQRLDAARRKLGASNRREAVRKFMLVEPVNPYEQTIYDPIDLEKTEKSATLRSPAFEGLSPDTACSPAEAGNRSFASSSQEVRHLKPTVHEIPPVGGRKHNLSQVEVAKTVLTISLFSMICLSALVMFVLGIIKILEHAGQ